MADEDDDDRVEPENERESGSPDDLDERLGSPMQIYVGGECVYDPDEPERTGQRTSTKDAAPTARAPTRVSSVRRRPSTTRRCGS